MSQQETDTTLVNATAEPSPVDNRGPPDDGVTRTPNGVSVTSKDLVMKVFLDLDGNYSVNGYAERAANSFGQIYLCLDKGPEYDRQSTQVNAAICSITAAESFRLALAETRNVLAGNPTADIHAISNQVLASISRLWFDLPDTVNVIAGGIRVDVQPPPPPRCPGDFTFTSGYIFKPDPDASPPLAQLGPVLGRMLKDAVLQYVAALRTANRLPTGVLSRAVFDAFPSGPDDLIARTIIGVMMGMLPTIDGNLTATVTTWQGNGTFATLQQALKQRPAAYPYARASTVLVRPLMQAMQAAPVPDSVWRTAVRQHTLGTDNPVEVKPGDKITIDLQTATRRDLHAGNTDVFPVFGGDRSTTPHPTHACPGYESAIGIMLGVINGMMEPV